MIKSVYLKQKNQLCDFRYFKQYDNHEMLIHFSDDRLGLKGAIAIHNTVLGPALGGTRLQVYASDQAAIKDVLNLSRAMSYKCALAGLPYGGGKAVIIMNPELDRQELLKSYASTVEKLGGLFKTGTDVGVTDSDVIMMAHHTQHMLGVSEADRSDMSTSKMAALGVYYSIKAASSYKYGSEDLKDMTIGIKGLGKLGSELAHLVHAEGARLMVADIDAQKCNQLHSELSGITIVPVEEIQSMEMNIYAPCALGNEFGFKNISPLKCQIIAGGANNQLVSEKAGNAIFEKNILYAPDYIANSGGLIYVSDELEAGGFNKKRVLKRIGMIKDTLLSVFERSEREGIPSYLIADSIARERIEKAGS